jgi:hypothetical protein
VNRFTGVGKVDGGDHVSEDIKVYQTFYSYNFQILGACLVLLYLPRILLRYVKGATFETFYAKYIKDSSDQSKAEKIYKYLTEKKSEHRNEFLKTIMCEIMLLVIAAAEMCFLDYAQNGAFQRNIRMEFQDHFGAIYPVMGKYIYQCTCIYQ